MPNNILSMLSHLCPSGCGSALSPAVYTLPSTPCLYHLRIPLSISHPHSPSPYLPQSLPERKLGSTKVRSLLFYRRALGRTIPSSPQSVSSPPTSLTPPNMMSPLHTASSTMSPPTATPTKPFTLLPWLSGPVPTPASCPDQSRAAWMAARSDLGTHHSTFSTHPQ